METTGHFWVPLVLGGRRNRKQSSRRTAPFLGSTGASFCSQCPETALSLWLAEDTTLTWWSAPWSSGDAAAPLQGHVRAHTCWVLFVGPQDPFLKKTLPLHQGEWCWASQNFTSGWKKLHCLPFCNQECEAGNDKPKSYWKPNPGSSLPCSNHGTGTNSLGAQPW